MSVLRITGYSAVTPLGIGISGLNSVSRHGLRNIDESVLSDYQKNNFKRLSRVGKLACIAVEESLRKSRYDFSEQSEDISRTAVIVGNNYSSLHAIMDMQEEAELFGIKGINPSIFPETVLNVIGGFLSINYKWTGTSTTVSNGRFTGPKTLILAEQLLAQDWHDRVIICNLQLFPPNQMRRNVTGHLPSYESVTTIICERSPRSGTEIAEIRMESCSQPDTLANQRVSPLELLGQLILDIEEFDQPKSIETELGSEGYLRVTCHHKGEIPVE